jgi:D-alanyl-D-alanine carboxypeptidase
MYPSSPRSYRPAPNYTLRRLIALTGLLLVLWLLWTVLGALFGGGSSDDNSTRAESDDQESAENGEGGEGDEENGVAGGLVVAPPCGLESQQTNYSQPQDWARTLLDTTYRLPDGYEPPDLVSGSAAGYQASIQIRDLMAPDLNDLRNSIFEAPGVPEVAIASGYRSIEAQTQIFEARQEAVGFEEAVRSTDRGGHSEHHLGTAIDFREFNTDAPSETFAETATFEWLVENSWEYAFILSYPAGKEAVTCRRFEPYHFRYVGRDLAARVHETGLTLREYFWHWQSTGEEPTVEMARAAATATTMPPVTAPTAPGEGDGGTDGQSDQSSDPTGETPADGTGEDPATDTGGENG